MIQQEKYTHFFCQWELHALSCTPYCVMRRFPVPIQRLLDADLAF
ncbi:Uncharacterised protein [Chlamydia abortus]|nr:Uncharacterised protein [Chlamydia abortus]